MEYFEIIGIVFGHLFLTVLIVVSIHDIRETKKIKVEREECFSMISRCSKLLRLWETNVYMTDTDFNFLQYRIYKDYIRIHEIPIELFFSERERLILAEGFHWMSVSKEDRYAKYGKKMNRENTPCSYGVVFNMAAEGFAGFPKHDNVYDDLVWIYYMWLTGMFIKALYTQKHTDLQELKNLCLKIETWIIAYNMNSPYLKDKIKECRTPFHQPKPMDTFSPANIERHK